MNLKKIKKLAESAEAELAHARRTVAEESKNLKRAKAQLAAASEAQQIVQLIAQEIQSSAHKQIARIVTGALKTVFEERAYRFEMEFARKRGRTEASCWFARGGSRFPPTAVGGGVVDVASFALRLACLVLARPRRRLFLVLDEPFRHLSRGYARRVGGLVKSLAEELDLQILMSTHSPALASGAVVLIGKEDGPREPTLKT